MTGWLVLSLLLLWLVLFLNRRRVKSLWLKVLLGLDTPGDMPDVKLSGRETLGWLAVFVLMLVVFLSQFFG